MAFDTAFDGYRRFAVFYAPMPDSPLGVIGNHWLGREPESGTWLTRPAVSGVTADEVDAATRVPAHYGFHATLKPPFRLRHHKSPADLVRHLERLVRHLPRVAVPGLSLQRLEGFLALVPAAREPRLDDLAAACVRHLDAFRAPLSRTEIRKRRRAGLSRRQEAFLMTWGYPYVMGDFRFHLSLTRRMEKAELVRLGRAAGSVFSPALGPFVIDDLALFGEPEHGGPFRLLRRFRLAGRTRVMATRVMETRSPAGRDRLAGARG